MGHLDSLITFTLFVCSEAYYEIYREGLAKFFSRPMTDNIVNPVHSNDSYQVEKKSTHPP
jgi:hypothetical protein